MRKFRRLIGWDVTRGHTRKQPSSPTAYLGSMWRVFFSVLRNWKGGQFEKKWMERFMMEFMLFQVMIIILKVIQSCDMCAYKKIYIHTVYYVYRIPFIVDKKNTIGKNWKKRNKYRVHGILELEANEIGMEECIYIGFQNIQGNPEFFQDFMGFMLSCNQCWTNQYEIEITKSLWSTSRMTRRRFHMS